MCTLYNYTQLVAIIVATINLADIISIHRFSSFSWLNASYSASLSVSWIANVLLPGWVLAVQ